MTLDLYHKVLVKLYEAAGGKDSQVIDLKDLVKNQGFLGSYPEIFQFLSIQSWISETSKADFVKLTHWGLKEAKKSISGNPNVDSDLTVKTDALKKKIKELLINAEEFADKTTAENLGQIEIKLDEINFAVKKLKSGF